MKVRIDGHEVEGDEEDIRRLIGAPQTAPNPYPQPTPILPFHPSIGPYPCPPFQPYVGDWPTPPVVWSTVGAPPVFSSTVGSTSSHLVYDSQQSTVEPVDGGTVAMTRHAPFIALN